ncbi:MAG: cell division protein SepF [Clostridia bacterium]|nr:cell division protein SepF [Clostridia bacterium]
MNKGDVSIKGFFRSLFGKNESEGTVTQEDDFDVEYYRGDYRPAKPTESQPAPTTERVTPPQPAPAPAPVKPVTPTDKSDDFDFFDSDDEIDQTTPPEHKAPESEWNWNNESNPVPVTPTEPEKSEEEEPEEEYAKVSVVEDATLGDASSIADLVIDGAVAIVKIDKLSKEEKVRMFDFLTGVVYAINGEMKKLYGGRCVIAAPEGFTSEDIDELIKSIFPGAEE